MTGVIYNYKGSIARNLPGFFWRICSQCTDGPPKMTKTFLAQLERIERQTWLNLQLKFADWTLWVPHVLALPCLDMLALYTLHQKLYNRSTIKEAEKKKINLQSLKDGTRQDIFGHGCGLPCKIGFIEFFFESQMYCFCPPIYKLHGLVQYAQPQHISPLSRKLPLTACALSVKVSL